MGGKIADAGEKWNREIHLKENNKNESEGNV